MPERFYTPDPLEPPQAELTGPEAHHLHNVLRLGRGDRVVLFDGRGTEAIAEIQSFGKRSVGLSILEIQTVVEVGPALTLATAVPKGDRFRFLVEKATELGVRRLVPLATKRSVVLPRDVKLDKLRQTVAAACKQCGRSHLMHLESLQSWDDFIAKSGAHRTLVAHPEGIPLIDALAGLEFDTPLTAVVGPEGGFTLGEIETATAAGAVLVNLGSNILRIETAAVALAAAILFAANGRVPPAGPKAE